MRALQKKANKNAIVYRGDLRKVYLDPHVAPGILAYIPEQHASPRCERALPGGTRDAPADRTAPWCDQCTVAVPEAATLRRTLTGAWKAA